MLARPTAPSDVSLGAAAATAAAPPFPKGMYERQDSAGDTVLSYGSVSFRERGRERGGGAARVLWVGTGDSRVPLLGYSGAPPADP